MAAFASVRQLSRSISLRANISRLSQFRLLCQAETSSDDLRLEYLDGKHEGQCKKNPEKEREKDVIFHHLYQRMWILLFPGIALLVLNRPEVKNAMGKNFLNLVILHPLKIYIYNTRFPPPPLPPTHPPRGVLPNILDGGVLHCSQNPDPISDQNIWFFIPHTLFQTKSARKPYPKVRHIPV